MSFFCFLDCVKFKFIQVTKMACVFEAFNTANVIYLSDPEVLVSTT